MKKYIILFMFTLFTPNVNSAFEVNSYDSNDKCTFDLVVLSQKGQEFINEWGIKDVNFSRDSKSMAYILETVNGGFKVVHDGIISSEYRMIYDLSFILDSREIQYVAKTHEGKVIFVRGQEKSFLPYPDIDFFVFSEDSRHYAYIVNGKYKKESVKKENNFGSSDTSYFVVLDDKEQKYLFYGVSILKFIGDDIAYSGEIYYHTDPALVYQDRKSMIYFNNTLIGPINVWITNLKYSKFTKKLSYLGGTSSSNSITVNGKEIEVNDYVSDILVSQEDDSYILIGDSTEGDELNSTSIVYYIDSAGNKKVIYNGVGYTVPFAIASDDLSLVYIGIGNIENPMGVVLNGTDTYQKYIDSVSNINDVGYIVKNELGENELWGQQSNFLFSEKGGQIDKRYSIEDGGYIQGMGSIPNGKIYLNITYGSDTDFQSGIQVLDCGDNLPQYLQAKALLNSKVSTRKYVGQIDTLSRKLSQEKKEKILQRINNLLVNKEKISEKVLNVLNYIRYSF